MLLFSALMLQLDGSQLHIVTNFKVICIR